MIWYSMTYDTTLHGMTQKVLIYSSAVHWCTFPAFVFMSNVSADGKDESKLHQQGCVTPSPPERIYHICGNMHCLKSDGSQVPNKLLRDSCICKLVYSVMNKSYFISYFQFLTSCTEVHCYVTWLKSLLSQGNCIQLQVRSLPKLQRGSYICTLLSLCYLDSETSQKSKYKYSYSRI